MVRVAITCVWKEREKLLSMLVHDPKTSPSGGSLVFSMLPAGKSGSVEKKQENYLTI
jgi:hypothetical protein